MIKDLRLRYSASLEKSGERKDGKVMVRIVANHPSSDAVNDVILNEAFLKGREYFLAKGVIDYDHQTVRGKTALERASAIIGQPVDLKIENGVPVCYAYLFENNPFVKSSILPALETGSSVFGASVGAKKKAWSENRNGGQTVSDMLPFHIAITPLQQAVHDKTSISLQKSFDGENEICFENFADLIKSFEDLSDVMKAMEAGSVTDSTLMTGGQVVQNQSLEGDEPNVGEDKLFEIIEKISNAIMRREVNSMDDFEKFLDNCGLNAAAKVLVARTISAQAEKIDSVRAGII